MTPTQRGRLETLLTRINDHAIQACKCLDMDVAKQHMHMIIELRQAASELVGSTN